MADREQPSGADDDVDLPAVRPCRRRALAVVHRHVEVVAVAHQLGAFARVEDRVDDVRAHAELGLERVQLVLVLGPLGVDPEHRVLGIPLLAQVVDRSVFAARLARRRSATRGSRRGSLRSSPCRSDLHPPRTDDELREQTRAWLAEHLPAGWMEAIDAGDTAKAAALRSELDYDDVVHRASVRPGFATPTWPAEYGAGLSLAPGQARAVNEVLNHYQVPRPVQHHRHRHGRPDGHRSGGPRSMKQQFLRGIATNEEIWCQLFSEPGAGLRRRRARRRAPCATATSGSSTARRCGRRSRTSPRCGMLLARTDPDAAEAQGPHATSSSTCTRPASRCGRCVQITGDAEFNEVFFNDARIPDAMRGSGRSATAGGSRITTLMNERVSLSGAGLGRRRHRRRRPGRPAHRPPARRCTTRSLRQRLAPAYIEQPADRARTTSAPPTGAQRRARPGPRARSPSCSRRSTTSGCRSWPSTSRAPTASRGRARAHRGGDAQLRRRPSDDPRTVGARLPALAGQHHRGRHVGRSCATSSASACSGSRRSPTSRATCRGRTCPARADGPRPSGLADGALAAAGARAAGSASTASVDARGSSCTRCARCCRR